MKLTAACLACEHKSMCGMWTYLVCEHGEHVNMVSRTNIVTHDQPITSHHGNVAAQRDTTS